jgi:hypothetical protein
MLSENEEGVSLQNEKNDFNIQNKKPFSKDNTNKSK